MWVKLILRIKSTTIILIILIETKNILIDQKHYKDLMIYFTRYAHKKLIKMLSLHYHELME